MKLSEETKQLIYSVLDSKEFKCDLYEGLDKETRDELGQFYTPAKVCIEMIEMYNIEDFSNQTILDPCCGSGNLLIAMLCAGADSLNVYGNDYDSRAVKLARKRINRACEILGKQPIRDWQIHRGDATDSFCISEFGLDYKQKLEEHYLYGGEYVSLFPELTKEQEEFLKDVD